MTTILILEGNPPELLRKGLADSLPFVLSLMALDASLTLRLANPYGQEIGDDLLNGVDGVIFTGSSTSWATDAPEAAPQRKAMEAVFAAGRPSWGSCNGLQLATVVLGGAVGASPNGREEAIARGIALNDAGRAHPMMAGKPAQFGSPCGHRDEVVRMPEGAVLLAGNDHSPVQAMVYEQGGVDFWGVQYHPECSMTEVAGWFRGRGPDFAHVVADLEQAETDAAAAARLGASPEQLGLQGRTRELVNWLAHVREQAAT